MNKTYPQLVDGANTPSPSELLETEFEKNRWDVRKIPGVNYPPHDSRYYLDFQSIPEAFRPAVKSHIRYRITEGQVYNTLYQCSRHLKIFLTFFSRQYPHETSLHVLSAQDIDDYIINLKTDPGKCGMVHTPSSTYLHIHYLEGWLNYLERSQHPARPNEPTVRIIWQHHYPKVSRSSSKQIKYIPSGVLTKLEAHIQHLPPSAIPIVILLRASGWRISDVLFLKYDTCLEQDGDKFWLVGDIQKTRILGHKIPITKEVAAVILTQIEWVKQRYTAVENSNRWLFPASKRKRASQRFQNGEAFVGSGLYSALDRLAVKYQIQDEAGNIFHFRLHAFRHTKGVELVNNGMSLTMVQQWMAHTSPEMTLIYAKILDETMRTEWEKAVRRGIVQFNDGKPEYVSGKKMLMVLNEQQVFDPVRVRDYRHNTKLPVGNCVKPPKLMCKFTELPCFHCPAYVLTPEDLPALEAYEQQLLERIEIGRQANNAYWIEINQKNLDERVRPVMVMLKQERIVAKSEKYEREYTAEEWQQRQEKQRLEEV